MPAVRQDMVSPQAGDAEDLFDLQDHVLERTKEGEQSSMTIRQSLVLLASLCACSPLYAQNNQKPKVDAITPKYETIELGSVELHLGEPKADVLARLVTAGYTTELVDGKETFLVYSGKQYLGNLSFTADRLYSIYKDWWPTVSSDYDLAKAIFFATKNLKDRGCQLVILDAEENDQPRSQVRTVYLSCMGSSNRSFQIDAIDVANSRGEVTLTEVLEDRNQSATR